MNRAPPRLLRLCYCIVVLGIILPFGIGKSGWVGMATGAGGLPLAMLLPQVSLLFFLLLGGYRVYLVVRSARTLDSLPLGGMAKFLRFIGICGLYLGAIFSLLGWVARPLLQQFLVMRSETGVTYFIAGLLLATVSGVGVAGLVAFEFSRLLAFERHANAPRIA